MSDKHPYAGKPYMPSNGTEGDWFHCTFCHNCIHEKFTHTQDFADKQCEVFNRGFLSAPDPIKEWVYNDEGKPSCTEYSHWDWGDEDGGWNEPPDNHPINDPPNQLKLPLGLFEEELKLVTA